MVHQTSQVNGRHQDGATGPERNVSQISHELVKLGELQFRLFAIEGKQAARKLGVVFALLLLAVAMLVGGSIVGLAGIALFVDAHSSLSTWGAFAVTGAAAFLLTSLLSAGAAFVFRASAGKLFQHSFEAFCTNIDCVKSVLSRSGRS